MRKTSFFRFTDLSLSGYGTESHQTGNIIEHVLDAFLSDEMIVLAILKFQYLFMCTDVRTITKRFLSCQYFFWNYFPIGILCVEFHLLDSHCYQMKIFATL